MAHLDCQQDSSGATYAIAFLFVLTYKLFNVASRVRSNHIRATRFEALFRSGIPQMAMTRDLMNGFTALPETAAAFCPLSIYTSRTGATSETAVVAGIRAY